MTYGDLKIEEDSEGRQHIKYQERDTKTRKDPSDERPITPKLYATPETPETCPVQLLLLYNHKRPLKISWKICLIRLDFLDEKQTILVEKQQ